MLPWLFAFLAFHVQVAPDYRAVGQQTFVIGATAEAEQHLYVAARRGTVQRLVWVQYEHFLPDNDHHYNYPHERVVTIGGRAFDVHIREYTTPPDDGSDRAKVLELLAAHGLRLPLPAKRVRLVHVAEDKRSEVMIIYAEAGTPGDDELLERALQSFRTR